MNDSIHELLRRVALAESEIRLMNVYQGIPIAFAAAIVYMGQNSIVVKTEKYQIVCLYQERKTYIQYPGFPSIIKAKVVQVDANNLQAELNDFEFVYDGIGERRQVRVWPKEVVTGQLRVTERYETIKGELADVSLEGMGVYIPAVDYISQLFRQGRKVAILFRLPGVFQLPNPKRYDVSLDDEGDRYDRSRLRLSTIHTPAYPGDRTEAGGSRTVRSPEVEVNGVVANFYTEANTNRFRVGIKLQTSETYRLLISQFISQRQSEIIQEINAIYRLLKLQAENTQR
ncbi:MAG: hypothetical protein ACPL3P_06500 [Anaerolineales bacterium]